MNLALLVGCSAYDDPAIAALQHAQTDAETFTTTLVSACGVNSSWLRVFSTGSISPSRNALIRALSEPRRLTRLPDIDKLFFFFSGHGYHSPATGRDYLLPQDAVFGSLEDTSLEFGAVLAHLQTWRAKSTLLFLDVCRSDLQSGKAIDLATGPEKQPQPRTLPGFATFWSCSRGQRSYESPTLKAGVFTHALTKALGPMGRCKTVSELDTYLQREVPNICKEHGLPEQMPSCFIEPLSARDTILVSLDAQRQWEELFPVGSEIRRPVARAQPSIASAKPHYCGFDFGTTHSAICLTDEQGQPVFVPSDNGRAFIPSVIAFTPTWDYMVGFSALEYSRVDSARYVRNIKRALGSSTLVQVGERSFTAELLASLIIRSLAANAQDFLQDQIFRASVSAPANFTIRQCNSLLRAFELAGVPVQRLVGEPSAAALVAEARLSRGATDENFIILDLGGGTFDVAVVEIGDGVWEVKATAGDRSLGGLDYDDALLKYAESRVIERVGSSPYQLSETDLNILSAECERSKKELGQQDTTTVILSGIESDGAVFIDIHIPISRSLFRALVEDLDRRVESCIADAIYRSGITRRRVDCVVLAGQGAKIFTVREIIARNFPGVPIEDTYQESAVALGMGLYTDVFKGRKTEMLLLDSLPTEVGIRCSSVISSEDDPCDLEISSSDDENSSTAILIRRDTTIPTKGSARARVKRLGEDQLSLRLVEIGHHKSEQLLLGAVNWDHSGETELRITYDIDTDRTIFIDVEGEQISKRIQLNNFYRSSPDRDVVRMAEPTVVAQLQGECVDLRRRREA